MNKKQLPTWLTLSRLVALPFLLYTAQKQYWTATSALYLVIIATDWLDGYLARRWDAVTYAGLLLDPIVDKTFQLALVAFFTWSGKLPPLFLALISFRFLGQFLLFSWILWRKGIHYPYQPHWITKLSAFSCFFLIFLLIVREIPALNGLTPWVFPVQQISILLEASILLFFVPKVLGFGAKQRVQVEKP